MRLLAPLALALLGLGVGVAAGVALKPAAAPEAPACADAEHCPADPLAPPSEAEAEAKDDAHGAGAATIAIDKPFVVPVFRDDRLAAMVVASLAVSVEAAHAAELEALTPRLRDALLAALFRHANSGGFDGAFTTGRRMDDLRAGLLAAAREIFAGTPVHAVFITEIARQDA